MAISTCCGYFSLRTGTIVIGILNLAFGVVASIIVPLFIFSIFFSNDLTRANSISGGIISYLLVESSLALLLIIGVAKKNVNYVFPFVCFHFVHILLAFGGCMTLIIELGRIPGCPGFFIFLSIFGSAVVLSLHVYLWLIMCFFCKELIAEQRELNINLNDHLESDRSLLVVA